MAFKHYFVVSPPLGDGYACVATVEAPNKTAAKGQAISDPDMREWVWQQRDEGRSPFAGLRVTDAACPHGKCSCSVCREHCEVCEKDSR
jgi:hypothetical protein